jgi:hypothetical protein
MPTGLSRRTSRRYGDRICATRLMRGVYGEGRHQLAAEVGNYSRGGTPLSAEAAMTREVCGHSREAAGWPVESGHAHPPPPRLAAGAPSAHQQASCRGSTTITR